MAVLTLRSPAVPSNLRCRPSPTAKSYDEPSKSALPPRSIMPCKSCALQVQQSPLSPAPPKSARYASQTPQVRQVRKPSTAAPVLQVCKSNANPPSPPSVQLQRCASPAPTSPNPGSPRCRPSPSSPAAALAQQARQIAPPRPPRPPQQAATPRHGAMTSHTPPLQRTRGVILLFHSTQHDAKPLPFLSFLKALSGAQRLPVP